MGQSVADLFDAVEATVIKADFLFVLGGHSDSPFLSL
jgi:hypothetical protein